MASTPKLAAHRLNPQLMVFSVSVDGDQKNQALGGNTESTIEAKSIAAGNHENDGTTTIRYDDTVSRQHEQLH